VFRDQQARREQQEPLEVLAYKGLKVPLEQLVQLVQLVILVTLVSKVFKGLQELTLQFLGPQERLALQE
jgi:hypothetical protein